MDQLGKYGPLLHESLGEEYQGHYQHKQIFKMHSMQRWEVVHTFS